MTENISNVEVDNTTTFQSWLDVTNQMATAFRETVVTTSNTVTGNVTVNGSVFVQNFEAEGVSTLKDNVTLSNSAQVIMGTRSDAYRVKSSLSGGIYKYSISLNSGAGDELVLEGDGADWNNANTKLKIANSTVWHEGNDGSGSGLDADTLDGQHLTYVLDRSNHTGNVAISDVTNLSANLDNIISTFDSYYTNTEIDTMFGGYYTNTEVDTAISTAVNDKLDLSGGTLTGALLLDAGDTVSLPGISWSGDSDTGFFHIAGNKFAASIGGTQAVSFAISGLDVNVGSLWLAERSSSQGGAAGWGEFWIKDNAPTVPKFTDDGGIDHQLAYTDSYMSAGDYFGGTADKVLLADKVWDDADEVTLTDAATITVNFDNFINGKVTLGGNRTLGDPSNIKPGQSGIIRVIQDGTGSRTLSFHADYEFASGEAPTLSTDANAEDLLAYYCIAANRVLISMIGDIS